jgi:hypothetical protein
MTKFEAISLQRDLPVRLEEVVADTVGSDTAFWGVVEDLTARLYTTEEQADARDTFHAQVALLVEAMSEWPAAEFRSQVLALEEMYDERALLDRPKMPGALEVTYFATRTNDEQALDLEFAVRRGGDGEVRSVSVGTRLQGTLEHDVNITAAGDEIRYSVNTQDNGTYSDYRGGSEQEGIQLLKAVFADTLWATQMHELRSPDERERCNVDARDKMLRAILERRTKA